MQWITHWDFSILDAIAAYRNPLLDGFFRIFTRLGNAGICWIVLTALLLCFKKTRRLGICTALALILNLLVCNIWLKPMIGRVRPCVLRDVQLLIPMPGDASFPSGHAASGFAVTMALAFRRSRLAIAAGAAAALLAFSRLYLYVHFPTDVLGGIVIGTICAALACLIEAHLPKKLRPADS